MTPSDRDFFKKLDEERSQRESRMRSATANYSEQEMVELVKKQSSPDGVGTMSEWLERQLSELNGQVMFPRWSMVRRSSNKQEVQFAFIYIDESNETRKMRYVWSVDVFDLRVDPPVLSQDLERAAPGKVEANQQERRVREHEKALE